MISSNSYLEVLLTKQINFGKEELVHRTSSDVMRVVSISYCNIFVSIWKDIIRNFNEFIYATYIDKVSRDFIAKDLFLSLGSDGVYMGSQVKENKVFVHDFTTSYHSLSTIESKIQQLSENLLNLISKLKEEANNRIKSLNTYGFKFEAVLKDVFPEELFKFHKDRLSRILNLEVQDSDFELIISTVNEKENLFQFDLKFKDNYTEPVYIESKRVIDYIKSEIYYNLYQDVIRKQILSATNRIVKRIIAEQKNLLF